MLTTNCNNTFSGMWPMTKENTFYGYRIGREYFWFKSKTTVKRHLKGTSTEYYRATFHNNAMYINRGYLTMGQWK